MQALFLNSKKIFAFCDLFSIKRKPLLKERFLENGLKVEKEDGTTVVEEKKKTLPEKEEV